MASVIAGYYGFGNAGDELILWSLIRRFRSEGPDASITVLSKTPRDTAREFGVRAVNRWQPWTWIIPLLQSNRFVLGGGGLLQETSGPWNHFYYLSLIVAAKLCGCRTEVEAIGVDPIKSPFNRFWTRWVLNHWADTVSVRDEESRRALQEAGVHAPIFLQPDPVFELETIPSEESLRRIAFALSPAAFRGGQREEAVRLWRRVAEDLHAAIDFLVFFKSEDEDFARHVAAQIGPTARVRVWQDPRDLLSWIPSYPLVVASRFHALVLAANSDIPFVGLGEQPKVASLCRARQMPHLDASRTADAESVLVEIAHVYKSPKKSVILASRTD